jgi:hypothetical protein
LHGQISVSFKILNKAARVKTSQLGGIELVFAKCRAIIFFYEGGKPSP